MVEGARLGAVAEGNQILNGGLYATGPDGGSIDASPLATCSRNFRATAGDGSTALGG
jgi:hypothetical protein